MIQNEFIAEVLEGKPSASMDRCNAGLCPQVECYGILVFEADIKGVQVDESTFINMSAFYKCSECGREVATKYKVPLKQSVN